jgi:uncharacterized protein with PIN domain
VPLVFFSDRNLGRHFAHRLRDAGLLVEIHDEHFAHTTADTDWIPVVAAAGWVALTRDSQIFRRAHEREAVIASGLRLIVLPGRVQRQQVAEDLINAAPIIQRFIARTDGPWVARFTPPGPTDRARKRVPRGRIERWPT